MWENPVREFRASLINHNPDRFLFFYDLARCTIFPFSLIAALVIASWARSLYGRKGGLLAASLWVTFPMAIAFAGIAHPEMCATSMGVLSFWTFRNFRACPTFGRATIAGLTMGLAQIAKFSMLVWFALALAFTIADLRRDSPPHARRRRLGLFAWIVYLTWLIINASYFFTGSFTLLKDYQFLSQPLNGLPYESQIRGNRFQGTVWGWIPVPFPRDYLAGMDWQYHDFETGLYESYLRGEIQWGGWYHYYLYGLGIKLPAGTLILILLGLLGTLTRPWRRSWREELYLYAPAAAFLFVLSRETGFNHHVRYALPAVPYLLIGAGKIMASPTGRGFLPIAAVVLALSSGISAGLNHPHHLGYFNELIGGPENGWRHLSDSNIDWGQDLYFLKQWIDEHPSDAPMHIVYRGPNVMQALGFPKWKLAPSLNAAEPLPFGTIPGRPRRPRPWYAAPVAATEIPPDDGPRPGRYAISVLAIQGVRVVGVPEYHAPPASYPPGALTYFRHFQPIAKAGTSLWIYDLDEAEVQRVRALLGLPPYRKDGD